MPEVDYERARGLMLREYGNKLTVTFNTDDFNEERMKKLVEKNPEIRVIIARIDHIEKMRDDLYREGNKLETKLKDEVLKTFMESIG